MSTPVLPAAIVQMSFLHPYFLDAVIASINTMYYGGRKARAAVEDLLRDYALEVVSTAAAVNGLPAFTGVDPTSAGELGHEVWQAIRPPQGTLCDAEEALKSLLMEQDPTLGWADVTFAAIMMGQAAALVAWCVRHDAGDKLPHQAPRSIGGM